MSSRKINLDFDDSARMNSNVHPEERVEMLRKFINRVDRRLASLKDAPINRFSINSCEDVGPTHLIGWISNVLKRNVSELVLDISKCWDWAMPSSFVWIKTTVHEFWESCSVCSTSLKRLTISFDRSFTENHKNVSFDTPNLLYLEYTDVVAKNYPKVRFDSLVEARLDLEMSKDQILKRFSDLFVFLNPEVIMAGDATAFVSGIRNVKTLYLSDTTLDVLTFCCNPMPVFNSLIHLSVETDREMGWESLTSLLKNSPSLELLVFEGLLHRDGIKCGGDECICKPCWIEEEEEEITSCLSSSPVKVLMIFKFGKIYEDEDFDKTMDQVEYFLETMPNLEELIIYCDTSLDDEDVLDAFRQFLIVPRDGLTKCKIHVFSDNLNLSST